MTEVMYKRAYKLDGLFQGKILELGHPRSDAIVNANTLDVHRKLNTAGIHTDKKIILYAPTWKGTLYNNLDYNVEDFKKTGLPNYPKILTLSTIVFIFVFTISFIRFWQMTLN